MLPAEQVNIFLESFYGHAGALHPKIEPIGLGTTELVKSRGSFGSVVLGALITGNIEGKLSLVLEWNTAMRTAEVLLGVPLETFTTDAFSSLEQFFHGYAENLANLFASHGHTIEIRIMPSLTDSHFLLGEEGVSATLKLPLQSSYGSLILFLSFE